MLPKDYQGAGKWFHLKNIYQRLVNLSLLSELHTFPFAVINWDDNSAKRAKDVVWKKLQGPVFIENSSNQTRDFPLFLGK